MAEKLYGKNLVIELRKKAAKIRGVSEISFNDTADVIATYTNKKCSGSRLSALYRGNDAISPATAATYARFLNIPVERIEALIPLPEDDKKRQTKPPKKLHGVADFNLFYRIISHAH